MRLVDDHRVGGAEQIAEAVFLEREIGEQQVVIDDDDVGLDRLAARVDHVAAADVGAAVAEAVLARRGDLRPQRMRVAEIRHLGEIAAAAWPAPSARRAPSMRSRVPDEAALRGELRQPVASTDS